MKYLIDTNIFIFLLDKEFYKLSESQLEIIDNPKNELFICEASIYEFSIKIRLNKLEFNRFNIDSVEEDRKLLNIKLLKSQIEHYKSIISVPKILKLDGKPHADPFDLLIIATAQKENIPVLSSDTYFPEYNIIKTIS
jgi:PIN domain nuclease of toxin-antitoxin system